MALSVTLKAAKVGDVGTIDRIEGNPVLVERLYELGFVPGEEVSIRNRMLFGDPIVVAVRNTLISLRADEADCVVLT